MNKWTNEQKTNVKIYYMRENYSEMRKNLEFLDQFIYSLLFVKLYIVFMLYYVTFNYYDVCSKFQNRTIS